MSERKTEEYRQSGYYYIPTEEYDVLWIDEVGEWRMSTSTKNMRSCRELDKVDRELDELGYEIVLGEFRLNPDKCKLEQVKHMNPSELDNLREL